MPSVRLPFSRYSRGLKSLFLVLLLVLVRFETFGSGVGWMPEAVRAGGTTANDPVEYRSRGGVLAVTLVAKAGIVRIGALSLPGATYNGVYAGPVLHVRVGDVMRIRLVNHLAQPTNLHFHGIRSSPLGNGDNIHILVPAGGVFTYVVRIPTDQPPGLYWYHSHAHGVSESQVMGGMSGALVVDGPAGGAGPAHGVADRIFVLKDMVFDDDTGDAAIDDELHGVVQSINGQLENRQTLRPGQVALWRFSNQSANRAFHLALQDHRFRIVAEDGGSSTGVRTVDTLDIMPGGRIEALVEAGKAGRYALISKGTVTGTGTARKLDRVLGDLVVSGEPAAAGIPWAAATPAPEDLRAFVPDARRLLVFSQNAPRRAGEQHYFINSRMFDPDRVDIRVPLGNVEEWTIRNESDDMHVFHIHQLGFQLTGINGVAVPISGRIDTVRVPERGEVRLRLAFTDPLIVGRFVFHCHVLRHEDKGMMAQIEIYDPRPADFSRRAELLYRRLWWWMHGVPWALCVQPAGHV